MRRFYFVSLGAVILIIGGVLFSQEKETELDRVSRQVQALRKEVSFLATQIEQLKMDLAELRGRGAFAVPPGIPPGAAEQEINGVRYYMVPVKEDSTEDKP